MNTSCFFHLGLISSAPTRREEDKQPLQEMRRSGSLGKVSSTVVFVTSAPSGHREWAEPDPQQPSGWLADSSPVTRCRCQTAASPFAVLGLDRSTLHTPPEDGTGTRTGVGSLDQFGRRPTGAGPRVCARARVIFGQRLKQLLVRLNCGATATPRGRTATLQVSRECPGSQIRMIDDR